MPAPQAAITPKLHFLGHAHHYTVPVYPCLVLTVIYRFGIVLVGTYH